MSNLPGYRTLSADELLLISNIKLDIGGMVLTYLNATRMHVTKQRAAVATINRGAQMSQVFDDAVKLKDEATAELKRIDDAQPERWVAIANTHFQEGLMALVRAVAQPSGF